MRESRYNSGSRESSDCQTAFRATSHQPRHTQAATAELERSELANTSSNISGKRTLAWSVFKLKRKDVSRTDDDHRRKFTRLLLMTDCFHERVDG